MMEQIFLFITFGLKFKAQSSKLRVQSSEFKVQSSKKNPTSTREAGKNNIKIMKKIRRLNLYSKRRIFFNIIKT